MEKEEITFSASRVGTFVSCPRKYHLHYVLKVRSIEEAIIDVTQKGRAFHHFAEFYNPLMTQQEEQDLLDFCYNEFQVDKVKYPLEDPIKHFKSFRKNYVPNNCSYEMEKEIKFYLDEAKFLSIIDLLVINKEEGAFHVIDYKTSKRMNPSDHLSQMYLYVWSLYKHFNLKEEDLVKKVKVTLFYPYAVQNEDYTTGVHTLDFSLDKLKEFKKDMKETIEKLNGHYDIKATANSKCSFCDYKNTPLCPSSMLNQSKSFFNRKVVFDPVEVREALENLKKY